MYGVYSETISSVNPYISHDAKDSFYKCMGHRNTAQFSAIFGAPSFLKNLHHISIDLSSLDDQTTGQRKGNVEGVDTQN